MDRKEGTWLQLRPCWSGWKASFPGFGPQDCRFLLRTFGPEICRAGTPGAEFVIPVLGSDWVIDKRSYGGFTRTLLAPTLHGLGIGYLLVCGVDTHICVESTVRQAHDLGFKVTVMRDLVAASANNADLHDNSLKIIAKYFADVKTSDKVLEEIAAETKRENGNNTDLGD